MNEEYYNEMDTNYDGLSEYDLDELIPLNILEHVLMPPTFYNLKLRMGLNGIQDRVFKHCFYQSFLS